MWLFLTFLVHLISKPCKAMFHYFMHMLSSEPQFNYPFSSSWLQVSGHSLHFVHVSIKITPLGVYL